MKRYIKIVLISILIMTNSDIHTTTIGAVGLNAATQFQTGVQSLLNATNIIQGFTSLPGGLTFGTGSTGGSVTYNAIGGIGGTITLNGTNAFNLSTDLALLSGVTFTGGSCTIAGNNHALILPNVSTPFTFPSAITTLGSGLDLVLNSPLTLSSSLTFTASNNVINGNSHYINFPGTAGIITIASGAGLTIKNATLQGVSTGQFVLASSTSSLTLQNVIWNQDSAVTISTGSLNILNDVLITGSSTFTYSSTSALTINSYSTLMFELGMTFNYASSSASELVFTDPSAVLYLNGANLITGSAGLNLTIGTLEVNNNSTIASSGTVTIGNNTSGANDLQVNIFPSATLSVTQGTLNYSNINASSFQMGNYASILSMGNGTTLNLLQSINNGNGIIAFGNATLGTISGSNISGSTDVFGTLSFATAP